MIIDKLNLLSDSQALTAAGVSTDVLDTLVDGNIGIGEPMSLVVSHEVDGTGAGFVAELQTSSDEAFTAPVVIGESDMAGAVEGDKFVIALSADTRADRYFRVNYTGAGTATVKAFLVPTKHVENYVTYKNNSVIS